MSNKKFGEKTTALEVVNGVDLTGYEIIVTGGSSGIGVETVRALAKAGARVVIGARNLEAGEQVAEQLRKDTNNNKIEVEKLELDSLKSVEEFCKRYLAKKRQLNILINNAGTSNKNLEYTIDGFESQFGTNHLGHFALFIGLIPALKEAYAKTGKHSRVISLSSSAHAFSDINFEDINFKTTPYNHFIGYGQSKTANALFSIALTKLYEKDGIISNSVMPGVIFTKIQNQISDEDKIKFGLMDINGNKNPLVKTTEQGASTTVWAAVAPELENKGGFYLENCGFSELVTSIEEAFKRFGGYFGHILDQEKALRLWNLSLELINKKTE